MKKVLIIAYFFPPCNLTASQRAFSWAKYFQRFGYRPIIVTRRWDNKVNSLADVSKATPGETIFEQHETYDVYYLPYTPNLRDKIFVKYGEQKFSTIRRILTLFELFFQNFITTAIPYKNLFEFAEKLVSESKDINKAVITGNPYITFKIGYNLHKKFGVKWIADYRDAWTTSEINFLSNKSFLFKVVNLLDEYFEKKWIRTASYVTASSLPIAKGIEQLTGTTSTALYNGFVMEDFDGITSPKFSDFTITYVGTLYAGQKVEILCMALKRLIDATPAIRIKLLFPGLAYDKVQAARIAKCMRGYEKYFECTLRIDRNKVLEIEKQSHLLFHVAWDEQQGIIASKIYEYIASGSFILVVPSDNGSIQEIVESSKCGVCLNTEDDTLLFLTQEYKNFEAGTYRTNNTNNQSVQQYSRINQAKFLTELLDKI